MATQIFSRVLRKTRSLAPFFTRSLSTSTSTTTPSLSFLRRYRPLSALSFLPARSLSTRATTSSLKEPILKDGCDYKHWLVVMESPEKGATRDDIIDSYIKTLAQVVGSEEEARMKIYSVSTRHYFAFGALVSEELSFKLKELPKVRLVFPDSFLNVEKKDYGGEPFKDGEAAPYDPKYHEEWVRNYDTIQKQKGSENGSPPNNAGGFPPNNGGGHASPPPGNIGGPPPSNSGGYPPNNQAGGYPPNNQGGRDFGGAVGGNTYDE